MQSVNRKEYIKWIKKNQEKLTPRLFEFMLEFLEKDSAYSQLERILFLHEDANMITNLESLICRQPLINWRLRAKALLGDQYIGVTYFG